MRRKLVVLLMIAALMVMTIPAIAHATTNETYKLGNPIDIGPTLRGQPITKDLILKEPPTSLFSSKSAGDGGYSTQQAAYVEGEIKYFLGLDVNGYYFQPYVVAAIGTSAEVWVSTDLLYPGDDWRNEFVVITDEQVQYILEEFESHIYEVDTAFFGTPDSHDGSNSLLAAWGMVPPDYYYTPDGGDRIVILVDNIRDENYYDPEYPNFIAGFYSPAYEAYADRNMITIDALNWSNWLGPDDSPWRVPDRPMRPYMYDAVVAHEFQHLIHDDNDPAEETWINEGMSMFAEYLCGYGHPMGDIENFLNNPRNSLVVWGDQGGRQILADYGMAYLFQLYLNDQYGGQELIQALAKDGRQGIESVNAVLKEFGYHTDFAQVFRDFSIAAAIDSQKPGKGAYYFESIDLPPLLQGSDEPYIQEGAPAWGTDYVIIDPETKIKRAWFNGIDFFPAPWQVVADPLGGEDLVLWSNEGDLIDNFLIFPLDLTGVTSATLQFDTFYDIEKDWDYGFVQVSTDGGHTWTSLANENTTDTLDPDAHPKVVENVPGFTGTTEGWTAQAFDLSDYAEQQIHVAFRYVTDWAINGAGWYIKNIAVPEVDFFTSGSSLEGFTDLYHLLGDYVDYQISFVGVKAHGKRQFKVRTLDLMNITEEDGEALRKMLKDSSLDYIVALITHAAPIGESRYAPYDLYFEYHRDKHARRR